MRRTVILAMLWVLVAAGAVTVAWQGVSVVGDQVTDERPRPLAAADIESRLAAASSSTTETTARGDGTDSTGPSTSSPELDPVPPTEPTTPEPSTPVPSSASTTAPGETRTYNLEGGNASLRFTPQGVTVVFANPAAGFSVEVEPEHGNGVTVEFESEDHESRVDGWWDEGPKDQVSEED